MKIILNVFYIFEKDFQQKNSRKFFSKEKLNNIILNYSKRIYFF